MATKTPQDVVKREPQSSAIAYGRQLNHRARALVADALNVAAGNADFHAALLAQFIADPLGSLERVVKLTPEAVEDEGKAGGVNLNIRSLYLQAVQATQEPRGQVVDVSPEPSGTTRVHEDVSHW